MASSTLGDVTRCAGTLGSWVAAASLLLMMSLGTADALATRLLDRPVPAALEGTEALMVCTVFLALANTQARRMHVAVDLVTSRLPRRVRLALDLFAQVITLAVFLLIAWQGWLLAAQSAALREYAPGLVPFPIYPAKIALAVGSTLMVTQSLIDIVTAATCLREHDTV